MDPDSTNFLTYLLDPGQFTLLKIIAGLGALLAIMKTALELWAKWQDKRALEIVGKELTHEFFDDETIETYTEIYIEPYCSPDDPSNTENLQVIYGKGNHKRLFTLIDDFLGEGSKSLLQKARARPDLVKKAVAKAGSDGPLSAWEGARGRLRPPLAMGYSAAGCVIEVGAGVEGVRAGDRVACAGAGYASHAEIISGICAPTCALELRLSAAFAVIPRDMRSRSL